MIKSRIAGVGHYVPENVYTNADLAKLMDTSDEWIQERTGIKERRFATKHKETTTTLGYEASKVALERAGITADDVIITFQAVVYCFNELLVLQNQRSVHLM